MSECSSESDIFGVNSDSDPDFIPGINSDEENIDSALSDVQVSPRPESINGHSSDSVHSDVEVSPRPEFGRKRKKNPLK